MQTIKFFFIFFVQSVYGIYWSMCCRKCFIILLLDYVVEIGNLGKYIGTFDLC